MHHGSPVTGTAADTAPDPVALATFCAKCAAPLPAVEPDELDELDAFGVVKVGVDELGMPVTHKAIGLAEATTARLAARAPVIAMTITVATMRVPVLRDLIRRARRAAQAKAAEPDEGVAAKALPTKGVPCP
jgi:hypothetical protein